MILFNHNKQVNLEYDERYKQIVMHDVESGFEIRANFTEWDAQKLLGIVSGDPEDADVQDLHRKIEELENDITRLEDEKKELEESLEEAATELEELRDSQ